MSANNAANSFDLDKALHHVTASLVKTTSRPTKHEKLVSTIKALLGPSGDDHAVHSVLSQLLAGGKVTIDTSGGVDYAL